jgi:hypothetical protein
MNTFSATSMKILGFFEPGKFSSFETLSQKKLCPEIPFLGFYPKRLWEK